MIFENDEIKNLFFEKVKIHEICRKHSASGDSDAEVVKKAYESAALEYRARESLKKHEVVLFHARNLLAEIENNLR